MLDVLSARPHSSTAAGVDAACKEEVLGESSNSQG